MRGSKAIKIFIAKLDKRESNLEKIELYSIFYINETYQYKMEKICIKNIIKMKNFNIFNLIQYLQYRIQLLMIKKHQRLAIVMSVLYIENNLFKKIGKFNNNLNKL